MKNGKTILLFAVGALLLYWVYNSLKGKGVAALAGSSPALYPAGSQSTTLPTAGGSASWWQTLFTPASRPTATLFNSNPNATPLPGQIGVMNPSAVTDPSLKPTYIYPEDSGVMNPSPITDNLPLPGLTPSVYGAVDDPGIQPYMYDYTSYGTYA